MDNEIRGDVLNDLRNAAGLSIENMADRIGMSDPRTLRRWMHSEWVMGGNALGACERFIEGGRTGQAAWDALDWWRKATEKSRA